MNIERLSVTKSATKGLQYSCCFFFGHVYNIYLMLILAFISQFKVYCTTYFVLCCVLLKQNIIAAIFSCHNNSVLINAAPLFKVVNLNLMLIILMLHYLVLHYFNIVYLIFHCFHVTLFNAALFTFAQCDCALF